MGIEDAIAQFCSQPIKRWEQTANVITPVTIESSRCSQRSHLNDDNLSLSLSSATNMQELLDQFIAHTAEIGLDLLWGDQRWLRGVLEGISLAHGAILLQQYITEWYLGAAAEAVEQKRANAGRYRANSFLRDVLLSSNHQHQWERI